MSVFIITLKTPLISQVLGSHMKVVLVNNELECIRKEKVWSDLKHCPGVTEKVTKSYSEEIQSPSRYMNLGMAFQNTEVGCYPFKGSLP
jgi:hypothetical protein